MGRLPLTGELISVPLDFTRVGMPSRDSVYEVLPFSPSAGGATYNILRTVEFDGHESAPETASIHRLLDQGPPSGASIAQAVRIPPGVASQNFAGTSRAQAKLSIARARAERFEDLRNLIATLPAEDAMISHVPAIVTSSTSARVHEEQRNVSVTGYLYAASQKRDNDYRLIVGRDPATLPETYMTMVVSGLPPPMSEAFQRLKSVRDAFQAFFTGDMPELAYDFYDPPIPVAIVGSLFFDIDHASSITPGPPSLKSRMLTVWEVHPITTLKLGSQPAP